MIDYEKRKRIMQRSIKLGHCICNPKQECPCDLFKEKNVCLCAGERPEDAPEIVELTKFVESPGCASKINQNDLKKVLAELPEITDPRVLVSTNTCDDAGVYKVNNKLALVQSVDVFTPVVDDPYMFGQIAAANSVSDLYAMGGKPLTALSIIGFPIETLSHNVMNKIILGGMDKMKEAGAVILGGHSIKDNEIKFGFAVTGMINPSKIITNDKAKPGDILVLTKPIGTGIISFARQLGKASDSAVMAISQSMAELNKVPAEVLEEMGVKTATDITGFGLLGHLCEIVHQSGVTAEIYANQVPIFDEVLDSLQKGMISGAIERNREYASQFVSIAEDVGEELEAVLYDPQTSGGLLMAIEEKKVDSFLSRLRKRGVEHATIIGKIVSKSEGKILVKKSPYIISQKQEDRLPVEPDAVSCCEPEPHDEPEPQAEHEAHAECCTPSPDAAPKGNMAEIKEKFSEFMSSVSSEGAITKKNKVLMSISLSLLAKCELCVKTHMDKARALSISEEEINEAVWLAISFGGAPILMFYNSIKENK